MSSPEESSASSKEDKAESSSEAEQEDGVDAEGEEQIQCDICEAVIEADAVRFHCEECEVRSIGCAFSYLQGL